MRARTALLDGLELLAPQREALTVIGAQAVFERTDSDLDVPSTSTTDGDLAVTPELLVSEPMLGDLLRAAGYQPKWPDRPGIWMKPGHPEASIDLLAPESLAGSGRRSAHLKIPQGDSVVGRAAGIEMATVDRTLMTLRDLDREDRSVDAYVAGPAALLCAKSYKLYERIVERDRGRRNRVLPKDAADMWLLLASSDGGEIRSVFRATESRPGIGTSAELGRQYLVSLFGDDGEGIGLTDERFNGQVSRDQIESTAQSWMASFLAG